MQHQSRRSFLKATAVAGSALALPALQYSRVYGANEKWVSLVLALGKRLERSDGRRSKQCSSSDCPM